MKKNLINACIHLDDTDMYYVSFGSGEKNIVVLPGLSDGLSTVKGKVWLLYHPYKKYLKEYTIYMFSRKNKMPKGYSIREMAEDQVRAMKILGLKKTCLLGVSQGGMIAQYIAIDHPEILDRLVLAVTAPYANNTVTNALHGWIRMVKNDDYRELMLDTAEKMYSKAYLKKYRKFFPLLVKFTKPKSYRRFLRNARAILKFDARKELSKISCPTLIIAGDHDKTVGNKASSELQQGIPDSQVFIYKGLGHGLFEEAPDFYTRVFDFFRSNQS